MSAGPGAYWNIELTALGRSQAQEPDPVETVFADTIHALASQAFADSYPGAFQAWRLAERRLREGSGAEQLTAVGHHAREAMQAFATALVDAHRPPDVETDPTKVERRVGAVIAMHREQLGEARREALEALGTLWTKTNRLVQRQEHGAQKEGEPITWSDARRVVHLTLFCMLEIADALDDLPPPPPAQMEGGG